MNTYPIMLLVSALSLLTGCATSTFIPYTGEQQAWRTAPGAFSKPTSSGIPIYYSYPDKPYEIIGRLVAVDANDYYLSLQAKKYKADAIFIQQNTSSYGGSVAVGSATTSYYPNTSVTTGSAVSVPVYHTATTAFLIRWQHKPTP